MDCSKRIGSATDYKSMYEALRDAILQAPEFINVPEEKANDVQNTPVWPGYVSSGDVSLR